MKKCLFAFLLIAFSTGILIAQPSIALSIGPTFSMDGDDNFALNKTWTPKVTNGQSSGGDPLVFFSGGTALLIKADLMWEFTPRFAAGVIFQLHDWKNPDNHRTADQASLGLQFRVNFTSNEKKIIPFFQGTYLFSTSGSKNQNQATSPQFQTQTQPSFGVQETSNVGFGANFGVEFKLGNAWGLTTQAGLHGIQSFIDDGFAKNLNYGNFEPPNGTEGGFFIAFQAGLKFYTGRSVKRRDF